MAESIIITDTLLNSTVGTQVGGTITSEGYRPGIGTGHILYETNTQIQNGRIEFEMKGFDPNNLAVYDLINNTTGASGADGIPDNAADSGFFGMYDGRGITEPCAYFNNFRNNFFRWNFHWRQNKNAFKAVISCMAPISTNLNATKAVCGTASDSTIARNWGSEPTGLSFTFNQSTWYLVKAEWKNKYFNITVGGIKVWETYGIYDYLPIIFRIWLGSAPGSGDKYINSSSTVTYKNFKLIKYDDTIQQIYSSSNKTTVTRNNNKILINGKISKISGDSITQFAQWSGLNFDYKKYVDSLKLKKSNGILYWSFMGFVGDDFSDSRYQSGYVPPTLWPWLKTGDVFDFNTFNQIYFDELKRFVSYAGENDIVFVLTIFDGWAKDNFLGHPFYSINGGPIPNTVKTDGSYDAATDRHKFIDLYNYDSEITSKPTDTDYKKWNQWYLEQYVIKLLSELNGNTNIIYEIFNEGEWYNNQTNFVKFQKHFASFIKNRTSSLVMVEYDSIESTSKVTELRDNTNVDILSYHQPFLWHDKAVYYTSSLHYFNDYYTKQSDKQDKPTFFTETVKAYDAKTRPTFTDTTVMRAIWGTLLSNGNITVQNDLSVINDSKNTLYTSYNQQNNKIYELEGIASNFFNNIIGDNNLISSKTISSTGMCQYELNKRYIIYSEVKSDVTLNNISGSFNYMYFNPYTGTQSNISNISTTSNYTFTDVPYNDVVILVNKEQSTTYYLNTVDNFTLNTVDNFTYNLVIESNVQWNISNIPNWLNFSSTSGINNQTITIGINSSFITSNNMSSTITVSSNNTPNKIITINYIGNEYTVEWVDNGLKVLGSALIDSNISNVVNSCKLNNKITLEAWIIPTLLSTTTTSKIITIGEDNNKINILLGQSGNEYCVYIRTNDTDEYGINDIQTKGGTVQNKLQHLVFTYNNGIRKLYVDNVLVSNIVDPITGISNWNSSYKLYLSNIETINSSTEWIGIYKLISIYDRDLSKEEVSQNYVAGGGIISGAPVIISQTIGNIELRAGSTLDINVNAIGSEPLIYKWYKNNELLIGETTNRLYISSTTIHNTGTYVCEVSNGFLPNAVSQNIIVNIIGNLEFYIKGQPKNQSVNIIQYVEPAIFEIDVVGPNLKYQWYKNDIKINGATDYKYIFTTPRPTDDGSKFHCVVTSDIGSEISEIAILNVFYYSSELSTPKITSVMGGEKMVTIKWQNTNSIPVLYTIYYNDEDKNSSYNVLTDILNNATSYIDNNFNYTTGTRWYHIIAYTSDGKRSNISEYFSGTLYSTTELTILQQPVNVIANQGDTISFFIIADGGSNITYQWQKNNIDIVEQNSALLVINNVGLIENGSVYRCKVNNSEGQEIFSNNVLLTVNEVIQQFTINIEPISQNVIENSNVQFSITANGGVPPYSYQWYYIPSEIEQLNVNIEPVSQNVVENSSVQFSITANGGVPPYSYQWYIYK